MKKRKALLVLAVIALIAAYFVFDLGRFASLDYVKTQQAALANYYQAQPWQTAAIFFAIYVAVTGLSLPS
ncbi:MAG: hypothetical protein ACKO15_10010, partial [Burkholderiales bacterium]